MSDHHFWLSDEQFARLQLLFPNKPRRVPRVDDRRVISGIIHVIRHRFVRWSAVGVFDCIFAELAGESTATDTVMIDATHLKAHRTAANLLKKGAFPGASGGPRAA